ncbi:MAG: hypothetical protein HYW85_03110, partial [Deltaproteobacteria bacterium]|nr:hypothetical protein [Deltaproteobacteria bacterium]
AAIPFYFYKKQSASQKSILITSVVWCAAVLLPLSIAESKKQGYYLFPLNPALALMCGIACDYLLKESLKKIFGYGSLVVSLGLAFIFSCTPFTLFKSKVLRDQSHFKQYADLKWTVQKIISQSPPPFYYERGMRYVLNFHFSKEYKDGKFQDITDDLLTTMKQSSDPQFLLINKQSFHGDLAKLFIVHEMRDLMIVSNKAYEKNIGVGF